MKTGLLLGLAILAGCASKHDVGADTGHPGASAPTASREQNAVPDNAYQVGLSTETQLLADRGQPLSRSVAPDGTATDIYSADGLKISTFQPPPGPDGKPSTLVDMTARQSELVVMEHYVYSSGGILQKIVLDLPTIGPNGEIVRHLTDMTGAKVTITGKHTVPQ